MTEKIKLCECGCKQPAPIAKRTDTARGYIKGKPVRFVKGHQNRRPIEERFWEKVDRRGDDDCWNWQACTNSKGYGQLRVEGANIYAHRISYEFDCGEIPDEMYVLHICDTPACVNPAHLFLGTQQDNMNDKIAKGREARGVKQGRAKLTPENVRHIRTLYEIGATQKAIADRFGVCHQSISSIIRGETWRHVE